MGCWWCFVWSVGIGVIALLCLLWVRHFIKNKCFVFLYSWMTSLNKCIFICSGEYPDYEAAAIRHVLLARGLNSLAWQVEFWLFSRQMWKNLSEEQSFGLPFIRLWCEFSYFGRIGNIISRVFAISRAFYRLLLARFKLVASGLSDEASHRTIVAVMTTDFFVVTPIVAFAKIIGFETFHERTEFPHLMIGDSVVERFMLKVYLKFVMPAFDCVAANNDSLVKYIVRHNPRVVKILTVVDADFFHPSRNNLMAADPYIAYCGTMYGSKDGLDMLLKSFLEVSVVFSNIKLLLVGDTSQKEKLRHLVDFIDKNNLVDRVVFTGRVERSQMPKILSSATVLVLAKPANEQNDGNFPIKLGEYLATGVPVLSTAVGEIPKFIRDGHNGYLCAPNEKSFSEKLLQILSDLNSARLVGLRGRDTSEHLFDFRAQAKVMSDAMLFSRQRQS